MTRLLLITTLVAFSQPAWAGDILPPWLRIGPQLEQHGSTPAGNSTSVHAESPDGTSSASASISGGTGSVNVHASQGQSSSSATVHGTTGPGGGSVSVSASGSSTAKAGGL